QKDDEIGQAVQKSFIAERSGDVVAIVKPCCVFWPYESGTTHGTPHDYDRHVPLLVCGRGVAPLVRSEPVTPLAVAGILARSLGIDAPAGVDDTVASELLRR